MADALKDELANDPLARGYAGMTDEEAGEDAPRARRLNFKGAGDYGHG